MTTKRGMAIKQWMSNENMALPGRCTTRVECKYKNTYRCEPYECLLNWSAHAQPGSARNSKQVRFGV